MKAAILYQPHSPLIVEEVELRGPGSGYMLAALLGAIGGGIMVALATRAIPRMMSGVMSGMMRNMMAHIAWTNGRSGV